MSINRKSIFDTNGEENKEEKKQDGESQTREGYQVVHLEKQEVKSGEEDETTLISVKAKLYHLDLTNVSDGWKEKGIGILKVNKLAKPQENYSTRIVMRQDGIYKLILNVPVVKGFEVYRGMTSSLSSAKFVRIQFIENGKPTQYALKMSLDNAANLYEIIEPLIPK
ncbi:unnamed protein product [[Candida] boidinii]|nr:unnamed protein product [[Candida] boidinii]